MNSQLNEIINEENEESGLGEQDVLNTIDDFQLQKANTLVSKVLGKKKSTLILTQDDFGPSIHQSSSASSSSHTPNWLTLILSSTDSTSFDNPCDCLLHSCLSW